MTRTRVMDTAQAEAHEWLLAVSEQLGLSNERSALAVLRAAFHVLRDSVPAREAVKLGNSLPILVRGVYYEGWNPRSVTAQMAAAETEIVKSVQHDIRGHEELPSTERALQASFLALDRLLQHEALQLILSALPTGVRDLWPAQEKRTASRACGDRRP